MPHQMKGLIFVRVVGLLKHGDIVRAALVKIAVLVYIDRIDFQSYHTKILSRQLTGLPYVIHITLGAALAGENQDLLHPAVSNHLHLVFNLLHSQLHPLNMVVAVKATVDTVILAIIGNVKRREQINGIAEVLAGFQPCPLRHLLQKRLCGGREQRLKILDGTGLMLQCCLYIFGGVLVVIVGIHLLHDIGTYIGLNPFHAGQVFHVIFT